MAERIQQIVPSSSIEQTEISFQDARNYQVSSDRSKEELGFTPKWTVENGILEIYNTIVSKRIKNVANPRFNNSETLKIQLGQRNG